MLYKILDFAKLHFISNIIWDIDGTITDESGDVSQEVAAKIINLGLDGIFHSFITGRDAQWIIDHVIDPMQRYFNFSRVIDNLIFFAEVGCVTIERSAQGGWEIKANPLVDKHPLAQNANGIRDKLAALAYNPPKTDEHKRGEPPPLGFDVIYDANNTGWRIDRSKPGPPCSQYIWSPYKKVFATFEKIRDESGRVKSFDQTQFEEIIRRTIKEAGFESAIGVEVVSTAINIVPIVDTTLTLGKSWAAGVALQNVQETKLGKTVVLDEVIDKTIAVGDGRADFDFTVPTFPSEIDCKLQHRTIQIIFVGGDQDLPVEGDLKRKNIIIQATARGDLSFDYTRDIIYLQSAKGGRVVSTVLDFLKQWNYFRHF